MATDKIAADDLCLRMDRLRTIGRRAKVKQGTDDTEADERRSRGATGRRRSSVDRSTLHRKFDHEHTTSATPERECEPQDGVSERVRKRDSVLQRRIGNVHRILGREELAKVRCMILNLWDAHDKRKDRHAKRLIRRWKTNTQQNTKFDRPQEAELILTLSKIKKTIEERARMTQVASASQ